MQKYTITFIGAGNMASSLIKGLISANYDPNYIWATSPTSKHLAALKQSYKIQITNDNSAGAKQADIVVLAVKPQLIKTVALEIAPIIAQKSCLIISIAAGVRELQLRQWLGDNTAIVRCMPNTPSAIGCGVSALFANSLVTNQQKDTTETIFRSVGTTTWLANDTLMDTVTALSGSGPAYFFLLMEALENAAITLGLPATVAKLLTQQTALGSSRMAAELSTDVVTLRQQVTSPGGGTEQALKVLANNQFQRLILEALTAAKNKYVELSENLSA